LEIGMHPANRIIIIVNLEMCFTDFEFNINFIEMHHSQLFL